MRQHTTVWLLVLVVSTTVAFAGGVSASDDPHIAITDVTVTPESPAPGETVTVTATVQVFESSTTEVTDVDLALYSAGDTIRDLTRVHDIGTLPPGSTVEVPLTTSFGEPGNNRLRVHVFGEYGNGQNVHLQYPVVLDVADTDPQLAVSVNDTIVSQSATGQVVLSNGLDQGIQNVNISLANSSSLLNVTDQRSVVAELESGGTATTRFNYTANEPGTYEVAADLTYTTGDGGTRHVAERAPVEVEPLHGNVTLEATETDNGSSVTVDIFNRRNLPMKNVFITGTSANASVSEEYRSEIPAESAESVVLDTSVDGERASLTLTARYEMGAATATASDEVVVTSRSVPGRIDLTGISIQPDGDRLQITGSASNVGLTAANSVVVSVKDVAGVSPAQPNRDYFVGTVPESDFVSFDVYARIDDTVSEIPLEVTYLVDETRHTRTVRVPYEGTGANVSTSSASTDGHLVPIAIGIVVAVIVGGLMVIGWRNSRDGT